MYYWSIPSFHPNRLMGDYIRETSPDRFLFLRGEMQERLSSITELTIEAKKPVVYGYSILPNNSGSPIVSRDILSFMSNFCSDDFQAFPCTIEARDGLIKDEYYLINVTAKVETIDFGESDCSYVLNTDAVMGFKKLEMATDDLQGHHIAREKDYLGYIWVTDEFKEGIMKLNPRGVEFVRPEDITL